MIEVNLPKSGMGIEEGTIARWLKGPGDRIAQGDVIVEVETAKAIQEVAAPASGTLVRVMCAAGDTVAVNSVIAIIDEDQP